MTGARIGSSFRDPSGFLFTSGDTLYRQVQPVYASHYEYLRTSGLYDALVAESLLVPHAEVGLDLAAQPGAFRVIRPEYIPVVSLPYEWCFGQLRAAALVTLRIQQLAMQHGMVLKDASSFNVQFRGTSPVFVDTLSFERLTDGEPWVAYRQFCQHFLAPLALQALVDIRLRSVGRSYLDGVPLDLASRLLPRGSWLRPWALMHIHLHARSIARFAQTSGGTPTKFVQGRVSRSGLEGLIAHLLDAVAGLNWSPGGTEWAEYETTHGYDTVAQTAKREIVEQFLKQTRPAFVFDLGANTGEYSRLARSAGAQVVAIDGDPSAVERAYQRLRAEKETGIMPLWIDLTNPSPAQGWAHREWPSLEARGPADAVLALALVHHLAIGNNVPFTTLASYLSRLARQVIIEWVPKDDVQVRRLLASRKDVFTGYHEDGFVAAMRTFFRIDERVAVGSTGRVMYLMSALAT
ncbi:MAG: class I SAM-dependent methyltransferase [Gemmatimonadaceae bacterium]